MIEQAVQPITIPLEAAMVLTGLLEAVVAGHDTSSYGDVAKSLLAPLKEQVVVELKT